MHIFLLQQQSGLPAELQRASSPPRCSQHPPAGWPSEPAHTAGSDALHRTKKTKKIHTDWMTERKDKGGM